MQSWLTTVQVAPATNARGGALNGAPYQPGPVSVVVESSNATSLRIAAQSYGEMSRVPHFTLDPITKEVAQHVDLQLAAVKVTEFPVEPHRFGLNIWVVVLNPVGQTLDEDQSTWVGNKVSMIADAVDAPKEFYNGTAMGVGEFMKFGGIVFAADVPLCPGRNPRLELDSFLSGLTIGAGLAEALSQVEAGDVEGPMDTDEFVAAMEALEEEPDVEDEPEGEPEKTLGNFPGRKVKLGSGGKAVALLLEAFGLGGTKFDDELEDHVKMIQELSGLDVTGEVDSDTWDAIDAYLLEEEQE